MKRTIETCSLIKTNQEVGRGVPSTTDYGHCEGYYRRGTLHPTCKSCVLCSENARVRKRGNV